MMPVHIRRNAGRHDFIPAYSTDVLLQGVCHLAHVPKKEVEQSISRIPEVVREAYTARMKKSYDKFEANKEEIYALRAHGRGIKCVASRFNIGVKALQRYLEESSKCTPQETGRRVGAVLRERKLRRIEEIRPKMIEMLKDYRTYCEMAQEIGVSKMTIQGYIKGDPEFRRLASLYIKNGGYRPRRAK